MVKDAEDLNQAGNIETKEVGWRYVQKMLKLNMEDIREFPDNLWVSDLGNWGVAMPLTK